MRKSNKKIETTEDLINAIDDSIEEMLLDDLEEAQIYLKGAGIDPVSLGDRMAKRIKNLAQKSPLNWKNQASVLQSKQEKLAHFSALRKSRTREQNQQRFRNLMGEVALKPQRFATAYRKLEKIDDEELGDMLDELEFLLIEQEQRTDE